MIEHVYNYLDGPIHSMVEFFEIKIEHLEKSIPPRIHPRNKKTKKRGSKNRKALTYKGSEDENFNKVKKGKTFCQYHDTCKYTTDK